MKVNTKVQAKEIIPIKDSLYVCLYEETAIKETGIEINTNKIIKENKITHIFLDTSILKEKIYKIFRCTSCKEYEDFKVSDNFNLLKDKFKTFVYKITLSGIDVQYISRIVSSLLDLKENIFLYVKLHEKNICTSALTIIYLTNIIVHLRLKENLEESYKFLQKKFIGYDLQINIKNFNWETYSYIKGNFMHIKSIFLKQIIIGINNYADINTEPENQSDKNFTLEILRLNNEKLYKEYLNPMNIFISKEIIIFNCDLSIKGEYLLLFTIGNIKFEYNLYTNMFSEGIYREEIMNLDFIDFVFYESLENYFMRREKELSNDAILLKYLMNYKNRRIQNIQFLLIERFKKYRYINELERLSDNSLGCLICLFDLEIDRELEENLKKELNVDILNFFKAPILKNEPLIFEKNIQENIVKNVIQKEEVIKESEKNLIEIYKKPAWCSIHFSKLLIKEIDFSDTKNPQFQISEKKESKKMPTLPLLNNSISTQKPTNNYRKLIYKKAKKIENTIFSITNTLNLDLKIDLNFLQKWMLPAKVIIQKEIDKTTYFYESRILQLSLSLKHLEKKRVSVNNVFEKLLEFYEEKYSEDFSYNEICCLKKFIPSKNELDFLLKNKDFLEYKEIFKNNLLNEKDRECSLPLFEDRIKNCIFLGFCLQNTLEFISFIEESEGQFEIIYKCLQKHIKLCLFLIENRSLRVLIKIINEIIKKINEVQEIQHKNNENFCFSSLENILNYSGKDEIKISQIVAERFKEVFDKSENEIEENKSENEIEENKLSKRIEKEIEKILKKDDIKKDDIKNKTKEKINFTNLLKKEFKVFFDTQKILEEPIDVILKILNENISEFNKIFREEFLKGILKKITNHKKFKETKNKIEKNIENTKKILEIVFYLRKKLSDFYAIEDIKIITKNTSFLFKEIQKFY